MPLTPSQYTALQPYRHIFDTVERGERAPYFTSADEKVIEQVYNSWRGRDEIIINCDDCLEEAVERLMKEAIEFEK